MNAVVEIRHKSHLPCHAAHPAIRCRHDCPDGPRPVHKCWAMEENKLRELSRWLFALGVVFTAVHGLVLAEDTYLFDMQENKLRITIPDIPQIPMKPHPLAGSRPDMRYMGADNKSGYSISILTPTADAGMTPVQCASSSLRSLLKRYRLNPDHIVRRKVNETTFTVLFLHREGPLTQFKAYILSGYGGDHCIDVHISKTVFADSKDELKQQLATWFGSFTKATIVNY